MNVFGFSLVRFWEDKHHEAQIGVGQLRPFVATYGQMWPFVTTFINTSLRVGTLSWKKMIMHRWKCIATLGKGSMCSWSLHNCRYGSATFRQIARWCYRNITSKYTWLSLWKTRWYCRHAPIWRKVTPLLTSERWKQAKKTPFSSNREFWFRVEMSTSILKIDRNENQALKRLKHQDWGQKRKFDFVAILHEKELSHSNCPWIQGLGPIHRW